MAHEVTSWFIEQTMLPASSPIRKFTMGGSDYSDRVLKWPVIKKAWNDIRPISFSINLANEDQAMNFIRDDKTLLVSSVTLEFGYTHPESGDELLHLFAGTTRRVKYDRGAVQISIVDKFAQLSDRIVGDKDTPVSYIGSNYFPSDIAWWLCTSYGGLSDLTSNNNPEIDYDSWLTWANVFSGDSVFVNAEFEGQKVTECLRKIGRMTRSAIYVDTDNRITFKRFTVADSNQSELTDDQITKLSLEFNEDDAVNKQYVFADYDSDSGSYGISVFNDSISSINSFGLKEETEKDENVWYNNSGSAINLAQRIILISQVPYDRIRVETPLMTITRQIGETILITDSFHNLSSEGYRIMGSIINIEKATMTFDIDQTQYLNAFILDTSTLDGPDTLI